MVFLLWADQLLYPEVMNRLIAKVVDVVHPTECPAGHGLELNQQLIQIQPTCRELQIIMPGLHPILGTRGGMCRAARWERLVFSASTAVEGGRSHRECYPLRRQPAR